MTLGRFKILARKVSEYYVYAEDDKQDLWNMYKANPGGVVIALEQQAGGIDVELDLKPNKRGINI